MQTDSHQHKWYTGTHKHPYHLQHTAEGTLKGTEGIQTEYLKHLLQTSSPE